MKADTAYSGTTLKIVKSGNMLTCAFDCLEDEQCSFWSWDYQTQSCHFKDSDEESTQDDFYSGSQNCQPNTDYPINCVDHGINYVSSQVIGTETSVSSTEECVELCEQNSDCLFWSVDLTGISCTLKGSKDKVIEDSKMVSGTRSCFVDTKTGNVS